MTIFPRGYCPFRTDNALCDFAYECEENIKTMGKRKAKQHASEHHPICVFFQLHQSEKKEK